MLGVLIGWYLRKYVEDRKSRRAAPEIVYEGEVILNDVTAGPLRSACVLGEYDEETGKREILEHGKLVPQSTRLTTMLNDADGADQVTIRWEKRAGRFRLARAKRGEIWRIEFRKVGGEEKKIEKKVAEARYPGFMPFGEEPGGGVPS